MENVQTMHNTIIASESEITTATEPIMVAVIDNREKASGEQPLYYCSVDELVNDSLLGRFPDSESDQRWIRLINSVKVIWCGAVSNTDTNNLNGLICFQLNNLKKERRIELYEFFKADPITHLLTTIIPFNGLRVIVKTNYSSQDEYNQFTSQLWYYYQNSYGLTEEELMSGDRNFLQGDRIYSDPTIYYNPQSTTMKLQNDKQTNYDTDEVSITEAMEIIPVKPVYNIVNSEAIDQEALSIDLPAVELPATDENQSDQSEGTIRTIKTYVDLLLASEQEIQEATKRQIIASLPLISRDGNGIIWPNTINIIQGKYGQHKSRLAEMFASLLLALRENQVDRLNFEKLTEEVILCYLDSERNAKEEFSAAVQRIRRNAGYDPAENLSNFRFASLKSIKRINRIEAIESYLQGVRQSSEKPIIAILDIVTDCVSSFNDERDSMKLLDSISNFCEQYNATFLLVIHENPSSEKARGHIGTEAANKANTVMQISVVDDDTNNQLVQLHFHKLRRGKKPDDIFFQISDETQGFVLAPEEAVSAYKRSKQKAVDQDEVATCLVKLLKDGRKEKGEVKEVLGKAILRKDSVVQGIIKELVKEQTILYTDTGEAVKVAEERVGQKYYLSLEPLS